jgi:hypothetical protein
MEVRGDRTMNLREASGRPAWALGGDWHSYLRIDRIGQYLYG